MARILIVETYFETAERLAHVLERAGHLPILAPGLQDLEGLREPPAILLLDLDGVGRELLRRLAGRLDAPRIPVLGMVANEAMIARLSRRERRRLADILVKPVSGPALLQAVDRAIADEGAVAWETLRLPADPVGRLIRRLIIYGPDSLAFHICRRLIAQRARLENTATPDALAWGEIAGWASRLGLLDPSEALRLKGLSGYIGDGCLEGQA